MHLKHRGFLNGVLLMILPLISKLQHVSTEVLVVHNSLRILDGAGLLIKLVSSNDLHLKSFL